MPSQPEYFELNGAPSSVLTFQQFDAAAAAALREILSHVPARPYVPERTGVDAWENVSLVAPLDAIVRSLEADIRRDQLDTERKLGSTVVSDFLITESNIHPDAIHVVSRLRPASGESQSISYGARIQRLGADRYALWSDY